MSAATTQWSPTPQELRRAWDAVKAGAFAGPRPAPPAAAADPGWADEVAALSALSGPVVTVAGSHSWSGATATALILAETIASSAGAVRVVELASPARSGLVGAASTEHGTDQLGRWRIGHRDSGVQLQRLATAAPCPAAVPAPLTAPADRAGSPTVSVVDLGWAVPELTDPERGGWLAAHLEQTSGPVVLTARAGIPGLRHLDAALDMLHASTASQLVVVLVGVARVPRWLPAAAGPAVLSALHHGRVVTVPDVPDLAVHGLTARPLPRPLTRPGRRLTELTLPERRSGPDEPGGICHPPTSSTQRKDHRS